MCVCVFSWVAGARNNNSNKKTKRGYCILCQHNTHAKDAHGKIVWTRYFAAPSQHLCTKVGCSMVNMCFTGEGIWNNYMVAVPLFMFSTFLTACLFLLLFCFLFPCTHLFSGGCMRHAFFPSSFAFGHFPSGVLLLICLGRSVVG